eukprot:Em0020g955a
MPDSAVKEHAQRWYLGGLASTCATVVTHPLDLLKVHLQTQQQVQKGLVGMTGQVIKNHGILALYNGLSASLCRQLTYSTTRFGVYEVLKGKLLPSDGGFLGVFVGNPFDVVNIRMQNDVKLPLQERRKYFKDNMVTHFTASLGAGTVATAMTQPVDVMKTRMMNAKPGEFKTIMHCFWYTAKTGPLGFFKVCRRKGEGVKAFVISVV